ncbi:MAG: polygalacturonase-like protein [Proteobacteria bacterium]|nr:polygalacturonase-like protein [Pseudomonadota bacterium]
MPLPPPVPLAVLARTLAVRIAVPGAGYVLPEPRAYRLVGGEGRRNGVAGKVVTLLHALTPDCDYRLEVEGLEPLAFRTAACTGLTVFGRVGSTPEAPVTEALQAAIDALPAGGTLRLPAGDWWSGPLFLKDDMTLDLSDGARLLAIPDRSSWPILGSHRDGAVLGSWEGVPDRCFASILTAVGCRRLAVTGLGTIDGGGDRGDWWSWPKETRDGARRARTLHLVGCEEVVLAGPTITNSPSWTVHPYRCRDLGAYGLTIENPPDSPNTDGFDPESCEDVAIEGVRFSVGDDCIAIKAGRRTAGDNSHLAPTRRVAIRHCLMRRGHGGVVLGSEMSGGIEDVTVEDCDMHRTDRGLRLKTRRGRGGYMRRVAFRRVRMDRVDTAISTNGFYFCDVDGHACWVQSRAPAPVDETTPEVSDIDIDDLDLHRVRLAVAVLLGLPEAPVRGVRIGRIRADFEPAAPPAVPLMADHVRPVSGAGIIREFAEIEFTAGLPLNVPVVDGVSSPC